MPIKHSSKESYAILVLINFKLKVFIMAVFVSNNGGNYQLAEAFLKKQ